MSSWWPDVMIRLTLSLNPTAATCLGIWSCKTLSSLIAENRGQTPQQHLSLYCTSSTIRPRVAFAVLYLYCQHYRLVRTFIVFLSREETVNTSSFHLPNTGKPVIRSYRIGHSHFHHRFSTINLPSSIENISEIIRNQILLSTVKSNGGGSIKKPWRSENLKLLFRAKQLVFKNFRKIVNRPTS